MNYAKIDECSVADGEGCRVVLYCSGCQIGCLGCQNPDACDFNYGKPFDQDAERKLIKALDKPYIKGLTLSGGHPLEEKNISTVNHIVETVRMFFPCQTIWLYTGFTWEEILAQDKKYENFEVNAVSALDVVKSCDVLVDGRFEEELRDITLPFRGSSNQRIIDIQQTLKKGEIVLWQK